eukprot:COSAG06_NODE_8047_length_2289_cov_7.396347_2_plen_39_part_00
MRTRRAGVEQASEVAANQGDCECERATMQQPKHENFHL